MKDPIPALDRRLPLALAVPGEIVGLLVLVLLERRKDLGRKWTIDGSARLLGVKE